MPALERRLAQALAGTPLAVRLELAAAPLVERRGKDACLAQLDGAALRGLARLVASSPDSARYLSSRAELLADLVAIDEDALRRRTEALPARQLDQAGPLEDFLDALRLLQRDETVFAACCQLAGLAGFEQVSLHLSQVAESCVRQALEVAERAAEPDRLSVLGMGKLAGRELTYHSDLDLIFLYPDRVADVTEPARTARRLISYLSTMTGAGFAYAVDSRLRPSGRQGVLVSSYDAFKRYQGERAALWEHLALMRARAIAGRSAEAQQALESTRAVVLRESRSPWREVSEMRQRVESERARNDPGRLELKLGPGGLMDVDFLAAGTLLETGRALDSGELPAIPAMLRVADPTPVAELLERYAFLRHVEALARWVSGRAIEWLPTSGERMELVAELLEPGLRAQALVARLRERLGANRRGFDAVVRAGTIRALCELEERGVSGG